MKFFKYLIFSITFILLTIVTQIGGIVFLINIWMGKYIGKYFSSRWLSALCKTLSFLILYCLSTIFIIPPLAALFGRQALPVLGHKSLKPSNVFTCLLNRHYVKPSLNTAILRTSQQFSLQYLGSTVYYLDANFPFMDGFPLIPHWSHNDGRKLDLAFCYKEYASGKPSEGALSFIGYGICEESRIGEVNTAKMCREKGYWQYSVLQKIVPQGVKREYYFDAERTKTLISLLSSQREVTKIFIEPHLVNRLRLNRTKIRFHGCHAVRHDDHIHVQ